MQKNDKIYQKTEIITDKKTGEIISQNRKESLPVGKEPNYYKVYIDDLANLQGLNPTEKRVLEVLSGNMTFDNLIVVIKPIKEKLVKIIGKEYETIRRAIETLAKKKILLKEDRACYRVNPNYIAKGKWEDIKALRLVVDYTSQGRKISIEKVTPYQIDYTIIDDEKPITYDVPPNQTYFDFNDNGDIEIKKHSDDSFL